MDKIFDFNLQKPVKLVDLDVDWKNLIINSQKLSIDDFDYLKLINKFSNNITTKNGTGGIFAYKFLYKNNPSFESLLKAIDLPENYTLFDKTIYHYFVRYLLAKTEIFNSLSFYENNSDELFDKIISVLSNQYCRFNKNQLSVTEELSDYLYHYGMYEYFFNYYTKDYAYKTTLNFTEKIFNNNIDNLTSFIFFGGWNNWFDKHSCSDKTFIFINKSTCEIWLLCFSHSD